MAHDGAGGRIAPDGRPPQAKGVGKNAKRHDLERAATPGLAGSDLQQGDVQALESGQRVAPIKENPRGRAPRPSGGGQSGGQTRGAQSGRVSGAPDAIEFLGAQQGSEFNVPEGVLQSSDNLTSWLPFVRQMVIGPGTSGLLAGAYINQFRQLLRSASVTRSTVIDLENIDDALEAGLEEGF